MQCTSRSVSRECSHGLRCTWHLIPCLHICKNNFLKKLPCWHSVLVRRHVPFFGPAAHSLILTSLTNHTAGLQQPPSSLALSRFKPTNSVCFHLTILAMSWKLDCKSIPPLQEFPWLASWYVDFKDLPDWHLTISQLVAAQTFWSVSSRPEIGSQDRMCLKAYTSPQRQSFSLTSI